MPQLGVQQTNHYVSFMIYLLNSRHITIHHTVKWTSSQLPSFDHQSSVILMTFSFTRELNSDNLLDFLFCLPQSHSELVACHLLLIWGLVIPKMFYLLSKPVILSFDFFWSHKIWIFQFELNAKKLSLTTCKDFNILSMSFPITFPRMENFILMFHNSIIYLPVVYWTINNVSSTKHWKMTTLIFHNSGCTFSIKTISTW